jgi:hypothetical protein
MATVNEVLARYEALDVAKVAHEVAAKYKDELVEIQKDQLWAGKNLKGDDLTPSILDDPYFVEKAERAGAKDVQFIAKQMAQEWSDFKDTQHQWAGNPEFGERKKGYPNLIFTTGIKVWEQLDVIDTGDELFIDGGLLHRELEDKYGGVFGLNPVGVRYFNERYFRKAFFENIRKRLSR